MVKITYFFDKERREFFDYNIEPTKAITEITNPDLIKILRRKNYVKNK